MQPIALPKKIEIIKSQKNRATLVIEPCFPGYGLTLGNALRRVLLSSLPGAAVTGVKIKGVDHEFSTIPNVAEDVVQIILNLKQLRLKVHRDEPVKIILKAKGEKKVKASDIKTTSDVEIANPDFLIATLTHRKAELEMEITVARGRGYQPVEQREGEMREIGEIAIDAFFTPVRKVSYKIDNIRVGEMTNFDKLNIDIETDGIITPQEALEEAAKILVDHFSLLGGIREVKPRAKKVAPKRESKIKKREVTLAEKVKKIEGLPLEELKLSSRTFNLLKKKRINRVKDLVKLTEKKLLKLSGIGETTAKELKRALGRKGILLKQE